jgi:CRP-like cAMP-binding protein
MVRWALKGPRSERTGTMTQARMAKRLALDIIAVQPLERLRVHADRLDYSVLEHTQMNSKANWKSLVTALQHKASDNLVGRQILQQYLRKDELPQWLNVDGPADLSRSLRWLMLCEVSERMAASGAASSAGEQSTSATLKSAWPTQKKKEGEMSQGGGLFERYGRVFEAGERLFAEGDTSKEMYVLQQGKVRISRLRDGQQRSLVVLGDGEFFGEMAVLNGDPRSATATVETRSRMLVLEPEAFAALIRNKPDVAVRMIKKLTGRLRVANEHIQQLLVLDPNERVATFLIKMAKTEGNKHEDGVSIRVVANDLVSNVGLDLLRVESVLKNMEKAKVIERFEGGIKLRSAQLLERYVAHIKKAGRSR